MKTTIDLVALFSEVSAELEAARIESEKECDRIVAERKAEIRAHARMVRAAAKRGQF